MLLVKCTKVLEPRENVLGARGKVLKARGKVLKAREEVLNPDGENLEALLHEVSALYRTVGIVRQARYYIVVGSSRGKRIATCSLLFMKLLIPETMRLSLLSTVAC